MVSRRRVAWCDFLMDFSIADAAVNLDNLLVNAPVSDTLTVTRIIGDFWCMAAPTSELEGISNVDCGIGVINEEAFDLGTGVGIPNPTVEDSTPPRGWLYASRQPMFLSIPGGGTAGGHGMLPAHFKFDLRGQRKVDKGVLYMWIEQNLSAGSAQSLVVSGRVRTLFKT